MKQYILFLSLVPFIPFSCLVALASISGSSRLEVVVRGLTPEAGAALVAVSACVAPGRAAALGAVGHAASPSALSASLTAVCPPAWQAEVAVGGGVWTLSRGHSLPM